MGWTVYDSSGRIQVAKHDDYATSHIITPAQITSSQNDYNPADAGTLRLTSDASRNITGIVAGVNGRVLNIINVGSFPINLVDESVASSANNRLKVTNASYEILLPGDSVTLTYSTASNRWETSAAGPGSLLDRLTVPGNGFIGPISFYDNLYLGQSRLPTQLTGNVNDYNPTGWNNTEVLDLSADAAGRTITGFDYDGGDDAYGRLVLIENDGQYPIILAHQSASSTLNNRLYCPGGIDYVLWPRTGVLVWYDFSWSGWRVMAERQPVLSVGPDTTKAFNTSVAENTLVKYTVPARALVTGDTLRLTAWGRLFNNSAGAVNYTWRLKFGGTTLHATAGVSYGLSSLQRAWRVTLEMMCESDSVQKSIAVLLGTSTGVDGATWAPFGSSETKIGYGSAAESLTADKDIKLTCQMGTSDANAQIDVRGWLVERVGAGKLTAWAS